MRREVGDECPHRRSPPGRHPDASRRNARPGLAATDNGEVRAECGERFCRRQPNAIGGTRDQDLLVVPGKGPNASTGAPHKTSERPQAHCTLTPLTISMASPPAMSNTCQPAA